MGTGFEPELLFRIGKLTKRMGKRSNSPQLHKKEQQRYKRM